MRLKLSMSSYAATLRQAVLNMVVRRLQHFAFSVATGIIS